jgi:hypothetical protein
MDFRDHVNTISLQLLYVNQNNGANTSFGSCSAVRDDPNYCYCDGAVQAEPKFVFDGDTSGKYIIYVM